MTTKICCKCKTEKEINEFGAENRSKDGKNSCCKKCVRERGSISYHKNIEKSRESRRKSGKKYREENPEKVKSSFNKSFEKNKEKIRAYQKIWKQENAEIIHNKLHEYYQNNKEEYRIKSREAHLKKEYGISYTQYINMFDEQSGLCAICYKPEVTIEKRTGRIRALAVDHDHSTGKIRALLCYCCNKGIGYLKENQDIIKNASLYLERHNND